MSFILDALRKSENERQRQATPGIADTRYPKPRDGKKRWLWVLTAVLVLNALLVAVLLLRDDAPPPPERVVETRAAPPARPAPLREPVQVPQEREDIRPLADEVADAETEAPPAPRPAAPAPAPRPATTPASTATTPGIVRSALPSMQQLVLDGELEMPPLRLDIHVYSEQVGERFVFINMKKYRQGDTLEEGPRLVEITPQGTVLQHQGNRFALDR